MAIRLSSYQKLKLHNQTLQDEVFRLRKLISKGDYEEMRQEKMMFDFEMDLENAYWAGERTEWDGQYVLFPEMFSLGLQTRISYSMPVK